MKIISLRGSGTTKTLPFCLIELGRRRHGISFPKKARVIFILFGKKHTDTCSHPTPGCPH
jgi:hypothetical protein